MIIFCIMFNEMHKIKKTWGALTPTGRYLHKKLPVKGLARCCSR